MTSESEKYVMKQEVVELTTLLREDGDFAEVRQVAVSKGLSLDDILLAGFINCEDESILGAFVVEDGECFSFEIDPGGTLVRWDAVGDISSLDDSFTAVAVAVEMKRNGEIV